VAAQLARLGALSLPQGRLGLEVIEDCWRAGQSEQAPAPVFHVAGTNGKGSTCAYLRAMLEAQGLPSTAPPSRIWCAITNGSASRAN
jgi:dihydrofolate synthase/folylpolyglutamate synthase